MILDTNVQAFFQGVVSEAVEKQSIAASEETVHYVVNLLVSFTDTRTLYERTPDGLMITPLASLYGEAVAATNPEERTQRLKRLGDLALFVAGVFTDSLNRKPVDVDYYIAMGGNAYDYLSDTTRTVWRWQALSGVFGELAENFTGFVDVLGEVCEQAHFRNDRDILRLYELWLRTGSARAARQLRRVGIEPASGSVSRSQH
ncbi:MAG: hypothetical protein R3202_12585 [Candidatus Competibacterales bacterium]|nr:hypothetical protein [Candidatus Competibacterales bacterium]